MRSRILFFAFIFAAGSLVLPYVAHAAIPFFGPIIPQGANQAVCPASWGMLIDVINRIIELAITLAIVFIAPIMIAYAGFLLVTGQGNPGTISKAKGLILQVVVGIVIALAGWLIVDAIMAVLYNANAPTDTKGGVLGTWSSIISSGGIAPCLQQAGALPGDTLNQADTNAIAVVPTPVGNARNAENEEAVRKRFTDAKVGINKPVCPPTSGPLCGGTPPSCTNVGGMQEATIQQVINLANKTCEWCVTITGGTEPGHACGTTSHQNGYKVDLNLSFAVNDYLESMKRDGNREGGEPGPRYRDTCGKNEYVKADTHWDITILGYCPWFK